MLQLVILGCQLNKLSKKSVKFLERPFDEENVLKIINGCDVNKTSSSDGYNINFFKKQWSMVKVDVMKLMDRLFHCDKLRYSVNASIIAFIPKVPNMTNLKEYHLISLVGCLYKILAKTLANRLKMVMGEMIGCNQFCLYPMLSINRLRSYCQ